MHLAFHLDHVSALACKGSEKFRSGLKETEPETSRETGGKALNGGWPDSCSADLSGFPSEKHQAGSCGGPELSSYSRDERRSRPTFHRLVAHPNRAPPTRPRKHSTPVWPSRVCTCKVALLQFAAVLSGKLCFQAGPHNKLHCFAQLTSTLGGRSWNQTPSAAESNTKSTI